MWEGGHIQEEGYNNMVTLKIIPEHRTEKENEKRYLLRGLKEAKTARETKIAKQTRLST